MPFDDPNAPQDSAPSDDIDAVESGATEGLEDEAMGEMEADPDAEAVADAPSRIPASEASWADVWHLPVALLGLGLFVLGLYFSWPSVQEDRWDEALDQIEAQIEARDMDAAEAAMDEIRDELVERAPKPVRGRFLELEGDQLAIRLHEMGQTTINTAASRENRTAIVRKFESARDDFEWSLDDMSLRRLAENYAHLNQNDKAMALLDDLAGEVPERRYRLLKSMILRERNRLDGGSHLVLDRLMDRFADEVAREDDTDLRIQETSWMYRLEAARWLELADAEEAINALVPALARVRALDASAEQLAPLHVDLGRAYLLAGDPDMASQFFNDARRAVTANDPLNAPILVGLAEVERRRPDGNLRDARDMFAQVVEQFPGEDAHVDGLIGLADVEAEGRSEDDWMRSVIHFTEAIHRLDEMPDAPATRSRRREAAERLAGHAEFLVHNNQHERALDFLGLQAKLAGDLLTPDLMLSLGSTHEALGLQRQSRADEIDPRRPRAGQDPVELVRQRAERRREAASHFEAAAEYLLGFARAVSLTDDVGHGDGLWRAAINFDRARRPEHAIQAYAEFVNGRQSDSRAPEARNRLGRAYMATGAYEGAIEVFLDLQRLYAQSSWAVDSVIPHARCHARLGQLDEAERLLQSVVTDHPTVGPNSGPYRRALEALGTLYYARGRERDGFFEEAIGYLKQAVDRFDLDGPIGTPENLATSPINSGQAFGGVDADQRESMTADAQRAELLAAADEGARLRFLLADAYRLSAARLREAGTQRPSQTEQLAFEAQAIQRLTEAQELYRQVRRTLDTTPPDAMGDIEKLYHRNAQFYEADCAYDRGAFEDSIRLYADAAARWHDHPSALVAMVQIVNARCELGQYEDARVANRHALDLLDRLPDDVFDDETVPMSREHWETWLKWTSELDILAGARG